MKVKSWFAKAVATRRAQENTEAMYRQLMYTCHSVCVCVCLHVCVCSVCCVCLCLCLCLWLCLCLCLCLRICVFVCVSMHDTLHPDANLGAYDRLRIGSRRRRRGKSKRADP